MKLIYWYSQSKIDEEGYNARNQTKEELMEVLEDMEKGPHGIKSWKDHFEEPKEMVVEYNTPLDLLQMCMERDTYIEARD